MNRTYISPSIDPIVNMSDVERCAEPECVRMVANDEFRIVFVQP